MKVSTSSVQLSPTSPPAATSDRTRKEGLMSTTLKRHQMFIGGKWAESSGGGDQEIINPATGKVIAHVPKGTAEDVDRAVAAAVKAYDEVWSAGEYMKGFTSIIRRESLGVVGSIAPWNYPLMMAAWKLGPALAAGNTVILKPSEQTPLTALKLGEYLRELFPAGVVNVICGRGESVGAPLVAHPRVRMVSL